MAHKKDSQKLFSVISTLNVFDKEARMLLKSANLYTSCNKEEMLLTDLENLKLFEHCLEAQIPECTENVYSLKCSICKVSFDTADLLREHHKLDWHRYNAKQKLLAKAPLNEDEFFQQVCGELSSISGSDSEDQDLEPVSRMSAESSEVQMEKNQKHHNPSNVNEFFMKHPINMFFTSDDDTFLSLCRNVAENIRFQIIEPQRIGVTLGDGLWIYLMLTAGHFAGAVFDKNAMIAHKTFHRYTVRAKRGTSQGIQDKKQGASKSAGASIRRYNEAALAQEVQDLISSWSTHINNAEKIFYRCSNYNLQMFFRSGVIKKGDARFTKVSMATRRPTLKEVKRIHKEFSTLKIYGPVSKVENWIQNFFGEKTNKNIQEYQTESPLTRNQEQLGSDGRKKKDIEKQNEEEETMEDDMCRLWEKLYTWCKHKEVNKFKEFFAQLEDNGNSTNPSSINVASGPATTENNCEVISSEKDFLLKKFLANNGLNFCSPEHGRTLLHTAVHASCKELISYLLLIGCNPCAKDGNGKKPYDVAVERDVRNEFRKFMGKYPNKYDYRSANVPSPLTEEKEIEQQKKNAEKKKTQNKARKERLKTKKAEERQQKLAEKQKKAFDDLSDREKRAAMAERRFAVQLTESLRCSNCRSPIADKDAFERYEYKYCSIDCVQTHKQLIGK